MSWHGASGGGSEECDPNTGPYNDWEGAQAYICPGGLSCVQCKCVGCGDGRIQQPEEECDRWSVKVKVNSVWLWEGDLIDCQQGYSCNWATCQCEKDPECGDGTLDYGEECETTQECPTGYECNMESCRCDKVPYCGDGILDYGEQCEEGMQLDYHNCVQCQWITDCSGYCGSVGEGFSNTPGVGTANDCAQQGNPGSALAQLIEELSATCYATCGKGWFLDGISDTCCCLKANSVPCYDCPGQFPDCDTALAECRASIPM